MIRNTIKHLVVRIYIDRWREQSPRAHHNFKAQLKNILTLRMSLEDEEVERRQNQRYFQVLSTANPNPKAFPPLAPLVEWQGWETIVTLDRPRNPVQMFTFNSFSVAAINLLNVRRIDGRHEMTLLVSLPCDDRNEVSLRVVNAFALQSPLGNGKLKLHKFTIFYLSVIVN